MLQSLEDSSRKIDNSFGISPCSRRRRAGPSPHLHEPRPLRRGRASSRSALDVEKTTLGPEHEEVAERWRPSSIWASLQGRFDEAEKAAQESLANRRNGSREKTPIWASRCRRWLGALLPATTMRPRPGSRRRSPSSERRWATRIGRGPEPAARREHRGTGQGRLEGAAPMIEDPSRSGARSGPRSPRLASALNESAIAKLNLAEYGEAERLYKGASRSRNARLATSTPRSRS